jgi:apolipoprotein N-acyltransferase
MRTGIRARLTPGERWFARHHALLLAVLGGVAFALTSPPTDLYPAVVIGLALLAASVHDAPSFWRAFGRGAAWGTAAGIIGLRFVPAVIQRFTPLGSAASYLALVLLALGQSLIWAIAAGIADVLRRRARVPLELSFTVGVMVAVSLPTIFAWTPAGLVSPWPTLVQLADLIGERGVSAIFALAAALLARAGLRAAATIREARLRARAAAPADGAPHGLRWAITPALAAAGIFGVLAVYGGWRIDDVRRASVDLPTVRIGLINQSVPPKDRWEPKNHARILSTLRELTKKAEAEGADLTVWPEAAYPYPLPHNVTQAPRDRTAILGGGVRGPVLIGLITRAPATVVEPGRVERNSYNSATLVLPDGSMPPSYDKLQLLWFGEMVPGGKYLPWLRRVFQKSGGLIPGDAPRALALPATGGAPALHMGVLNCYEDTLPDVGRWIGASVTPNLLVNVTNDAWFFGTAEPELHARLGALRAVELRRDLVRSVNMGVVSWVDAAGIVRARYDGQSPKALLVTPVVRNAPPTPYVRFGDTPMWLLLAASTAAFVWRSRRRREPGPVSDAEARAASQRASDGAG